MNQKYFIVSIDTEGDNLWQWKDGDRITTNNTKYLHRFQHLCETYGFKPVWLTNYEMICDEDYVDFITKVENEKNGELGMHLHAWNNPPIYQLDIEYDAAPYLIEYPTEIMEEKIATLTSLIKKQTGITPVTHRAGRWAMNDEYFRLLKKYGYKIDCSVTPHINWSNTKGQTKNSRGTDYSNYAENPCYIGGMFEVPVTIIYVHKLFLNKGVTIKNLAKSAFHFVRGEELWLRPNGHNLEKMIFLLESIKNSDKDYIMFMLHSSELMPGGSPTFKSERDIELLYHDIEQLFEIASKNFTGITLKDYAKNKGLK